MSAEFDTGEDIDLVFIANDGRNQNELLQCDIIGDPKNYYRGQDFSNTGTAQSIAAIQNETVIWNVDGNDINGLHGNFYLRYAANNNVDPSTTDYTNTAYWTDLGTDWNGGGSWETYGAFGTPHLEGEEEEDHTSNADFGTLGLIKLSKKAKFAAADLIVRSLDRGVNWEAITGNIFNETNLVDTSAANNATWLYMVFYRIDASKFEDSVQEESFMTGNPTAINFKTQGNITDDLIDKISIGNETDGIGFGVVNDIYTEGILGDDLDHTAIPIGNNTVPAVKMLPYLSERNNKLILNFAYEELITIEDENIINTENVKSVELPYFVSAGE